MMDDCLLTERDGPVAVITLNRPQARNSLNRAVVTRLREELRGLEEDAEVSVVLITGSGSVFCAGADLKELNALGEEGRREAADERLDLMRALRSHPKAVVASVNGAAIGGGAGLAMSCDLVIAGEDAWFSYPEAKGGVVPGTILVSLARLVGPRLALELVLSGRTVPAGEALQLGMLNKVVPHAALLEESRAWARSFATRHLAALRHTKALLYEVCELDFQRALERARDVNLLTRPAGGLAR
jgi:enoyl-CoA hydratase/carnithine racemase